MRARYVWIALALFGSVPRVGRTEPSRPANEPRLSAESAFQDGLRLMKAGKFSEAARRFEESQSLEPASGTLINLAYCHRQLGKPTSAWLDYTRAVLLAEASHKPAHAELARRESEKLEPLLSHLQLSIVGRRADISEITLDGQVIDSVAWTEPIPVDPGLHHLKARFRHSETHDDDFDLAPGKRFVLELQVPKDQVEALANASAASSVVHQTPVALRSPAPERDSRPAIPRSPRTANASSRWVTGFAWSGAAATTLGAALFVAARVGYDAARGHCSSDNVCAEPYYSRELAAADRARIGIVIGGTGISMLGAAALLNYTLPKQRLAGARLGGIVTPGSCMSTLTGSF